MSYPKWLTDLAELTWAEMLAEHAQHKRMHPLMDDPLLRAAIEDADLRVEVRLWQGRENRLLPMPLQYA